MRFWKSPEGQPAWARPALLVVASVALVLYAWNAVGSLEIYYAAAVTSMSMSWHNLFFAAFDPAGTVSLDKLPGAFWVQAVFVHIFGSHPAVIVAPQVIEGVASVLVVYRVVNRMAGAVAAITAASLFAVSPAVVLLNRGNISDTLMILFVLLAADAASRAALEGRFFAVAWAGLWIGLAFQAKMIEAWLFLPALAAMLVLAAPWSRWRRGVSVAVMAASAAVVSLSWMVVVSLWPERSRPYVDGSAHDSIFSQVFVYNGFGRIDQASPNQLLSRAIGLRLASGGPPAWNRLLHGPLGRDTAWLLPAAAVCLVFLVASRWTRGRRDPVVAGAALWGVWLVVMFVVFSATSTINPYYLAALAPAVASLLAMAAVEAWNRREAEAARVGVVVVTLVTVGYAVWLLPGHGVGEPKGLAVAAGVLGLATVVVSALYRHRALPIAVAACLLVPVVASISAVPKGLGPFDTPFESRPAYAGVKDLTQAASLVRPTIANIELAKGSRDLMATQTSALAAPFIFDTKQEVLPIGGFTGSIPVPSLSQIKSLVASGAVHLFIQAPHVSDPRLEWVADHCRALSTGTGTPTTPGALSVAVYLCG